MSTVFAGQCQMSDCEFAAALWVARSIPPTGPTNATFIAKPLGSAVPQGIRLCVDHSHEALDYMLAALFPVPSDADKPERTS